MGCHQRDLDKLEKWAHVNLTRVNKAKCRVPNLGRGSPCYHYRLGGEGIESSPQEKALGVRVDEKLAMAQQYALADQKATVPWAASPAVWAQGEGGDSAPLPCSGETPRESCAQLWSPQHRTELELLEQGQRRPQP